MDGFLNAIFSVFGFFATGAGLLITGTLAALIVLLWKWQLNLSALFIVQLSVSVMSVSLYNMDPLWAAIQVSVVGICCLVLMLSISQAYTSQQLKPTGNWFLRIMALLIIFTGWYRLDINLPFPMLSSQITNLFIWIGLCSIMLFCLSDTPLLTSIALLLWCIPTQTFLAILLPIPSLVATIGLLELMIALATGYLILNNRTSMIVQSYVDTDIYFPASDGRSLSIHDPQLIAERQLAGNRSVEAIQPRIGERL